MQSARILGLRIEWHLRELGPRPALALEPASRTRPPVSGQRAPGAAPPVGHKLAETPS